MNHKTRTSLSQNTVLASFAAQVRSSGDLSQYVLLYQIDCVSKVSLLLVTTQALKTVACDYAGIETCCL